MTDAYEAIREFVRKALLASQGDWNAAEHMCHRWLAEDPTLKTRMAQLCLEWVIRNVISAEGRRQQQQEADKLREAREAEAHEREIKQAVEELLEGLRDDDGGGTQSTS
jgi:hypothetical protein